MIADSCFHHGWRHAQGGMHAAEIVVQKKWRDHVPMVLYPTKPKRRVPVTALTARPNFHSWMEREVDKQVAAPAETRTPNLHRAKKSLIEECGWKGGDSVGDSAERTSLV